jgi:hypothetical protein
VKNYKANQTGDLAAWDFQWIGRLAVVIVIDLVLTEMCVVHSESWSDRRDVVEGHEEEAVGSLIFRLTSPSVNDFKAYFAFGVPHCYGGKLLRGIISTL